MSVYQVSFLLGFSVMSNFEVWLRNAGKNIK